MALNEEQGQAAATQQGKGLRSEAPSGGFRCPHCATTEYVVVLKGAFYRCRNCRLGFSDPGMFYGRPRNFI